MLPYQHGSKDSQLGLDPSPTHLSNSSPSLNVKVKLVFAYCKSPLEVPVCAFTSQAVHGPPSQHAYLGFAPLIEQVDFSPSQEVLGDTNDVDAQPVQARKACCETCEVAPSQGVAKAGMYGHSQVPQAGHSH